MGTLELQQRDRGQYISDQQSVVSGYKGGDDIIVIEHGGMRHRDLLLCPFNLVDNDLEE